MKKSLVALAVLAASGAAMAQSTVTLYGLVDTFLASVNNDSGLPNGSLTQTVLESGAVNGSRWGLKGSEDLGGGLKANFQLESGFDSTTGASQQGGLLFGRQAWVGFSGGFGAVKLGRMPTPYDDVNGNADPVFDSAISPMGYVYKSTAYTIRTNNTIKYESNNYSGFSGAFSYALGENKTPTTSATYMSALNLAYAGGPLAVSLAYQVESTAAVGAGDKKFTRLNGAYDFGTIVAKANYGQAGNIGNVNGADATEYEIGLDYKASPALTLSVAYAVSKDNNVASAAVVGGTGDVERKGFGLGAAYTLSKRTFLYGGYEADTRTKTGLADAKHSVLAVGVQHRF